MRAWLKPLGYSDTINEAAANFVLREFVMSKVPSGSLCNAEMIVELFRPQLEHHPSNIFHRSAIIHHPSYSYLCRRYKQYNYEQFKDYYNQESFQEVGREDS